MSPEKRRSRPTASTRRKVYNEKHISAFLFVICFVLTLFIATTLYGLVALRIPDIKNVAQYKPLETTYIFDRDNKVIERIFIENRTVVSLAKMPDLLGKAFVAAEDGRFFEHDGLDFFSVLRAALHNLKAGRRAQGGSTITQQVAKSLLLTPEKTYLRKIKEAILAWRIDTLLSKEDILYIYLNEIYLGGGAHGVETASQVYFNKHVWQLNLAEIAILAGLPQAPSRYSPLKHPERAIARQKYVLNRMAADGYITDKEAKQAYSKSLKFGRGKNTGDRDRVGYYTQVVKAQAEVSLGMPLTRAAAKIYTHMDQRMQDAAIRAIREGTTAVGKRNSKEPPQGALVCMDGCSGKVRALVGGTSFIKAPFNRAYQARRPAGSVFKPIVYSTALDRGWNALSTISDSPLTVTGGDGKPWSPKNFNGRYHGEVSLMEAMTHSYNIPAIRLLQNIGVAPVHQRARDFGITGKLTPDFSLALGTVDVSPLEMTAAYSPFICKGIYSQPVLIRKIENSQGETVFSASASKQRVVSRENAQAISVMLRSVVARGTGRKAAGLPGDSGGKTGTTNNNRDAWFIGFHNKLLTGVWFGYDRNRTLGKGENGGSTAAPVWRNYVRAVQ